MEFECLTLEQLEQSKEDKFIVVFENADMSNVFVLTQDMFDDWRSTCNGATSMTWGWNSGFSKAAALEAFNNGVHYA